VADDAEETSVDAADSVWEAEGVLEIGEADSRSDVELEADLDDDTERGGFSSPFGPGFSGRSTAVEFNDWTSG
jgi:hypothetical protein